MQVSHHQCKHFHPCKVAWGRCMELATVRLLTCLGQSLKSWKRSATGSRSCHLPLCPVMISITERRVQSRRGAAMPQAPEECPRSEAGVGAHETWPLSEGPSWWGCQMQQSCRRYSDDPPSCSCNMGPLTWTSLWLVANAQGVGHMLRGLITGAEEDTFEVPKYLA